MPKRVPCSLRKVPYSFETNLISFCISSFLQMLRLSIFHLAFAMIKQPSSQILLLPAFWDGYPSWGSRYSTWLMLKPGSLGFLDYFTANKACLCLHLLMSKAGSRRLWIIFQGFLNGRTITYGKLSKMRPAGFHELCYRTLLHENCFWMDAMDTQSQWLREFDVGQLKEVFDGFWWDVASTASVTAHLLIVIYFFYLS